MRIRLLVDVAVRFTLAGAFFLVAGCASNDTPTPVPDLSPTPRPGGDVEGPIIGFAPIPDGQPIDTAVDVPATFVDDSGLSTATLYYRATGTQYWGSSFFVEENGRYSATIPSTYVQIDGVDYYIQAVDNSYNRNSSYAYQADGSPYHFSTARVKVDFPYMATFEPDDSNESTSWRLSKTGWTSYVEGFDNDENWLLTENDPYAGSYAAYHGEGHPQQTGPFLDYLVSPPINLSAASGPVDLYWWEHAEAADAAQHQLLVSAGGPSPDDGDYEVIEAELVPAEGADEGWVKSRHVDLSAYAGVEQLYLVFAYTGLWGDRWSLDNISLGPAMADLVFDPPRLEPDRLEPGESGQLWFSVKNVGVAASEPLTATLSSSDPLVSAEEPTRAYDSLDPDETLEIGPFAITVDPEISSNTYVELSLDLTDGDTQWANEARLQIGSPATAIIEITHEFEHDLQVYLGHGDPASAERIVVAEDEGGDASGTFRWEVDLSSELESLPPAVGAARWFVQVWDDSVGNTGTLDRFAITIGDDVYESDGLPRAVPDDTSSLYAYLPGMADFQIESLEPFETEPGATVELMVTLENLASTPNGPLIGTLSSSDPDVLELEGGPVSFTYTVIDIHEPEEGGCGPTDDTPAPDSDGTPVGTPVGTPDDETPVGTPDGTPDDGTPAGTPDGTPDDGTPAGTPEETPTGTPEEPVACTPSSASPTPESNDGTPAEGDDDGGAESEEPLVAYVFGRAAQDEPFRFEVDPGHKNSEPLRLTLSLSDGVDAWTLPIELPVPYPVLAGLALELEDEAEDGTPGDGRLSPDESAELRLRIRNVGALPTAGPVSAWANVIDDGGTALILDSNAVVLVGSDGVEDSPLEPGDGGKSSETLMIKPRAGQTGDEILLEFTLSDGVDITIQERSLILGEPLWNPINAIGDPAMDASDAALDLAEGWFQFDGTIFKQRWTAHYPFDINETYLYSFFSNNNGYLYAIYYSDALLLYRWYTSGDGYWYRSYTQPQTLSASQPDELTIELSIDLLELGLSTETLYGGAATGNCGSNVACDYAPDSASSGAGVTRFWW